MDNEPADKVVTAVKICGLTNVQETAYLMQNGVEYAGVVLFVPKSKRNTQPKQASLIVQALKEKCRTVAVTVSPSLDQLKVIEDTGFDFIQIHGEMTDAVYEAAKMPIIRAVNVSDDIHKRDIESIGEQILIKPKVAGILFDGNTSGAGHSFDWNRIAQINRNGKMLILAGGLDAKNVKQAILAAKPDIVDVSSGVEFEKPGRTGKDPKKIAAFVKKVRER